MMPRSLRTTLIVFAAFAAVWASKRVIAQQAPAAGSGEWRSYAGDLRNHHYSPLDQITAENFTSLEVAWRFKTDSLGPRPEYNSKARH